MLKRIVNLGKALSKIEQKEVSAGTATVACTIFPDDCPSGLCCDVNTRRCVNPSAGLCA